MKFYKKYSSFSLIIAAFLLACLLISLWRCSLRIVGEGNYKYVNIAVDLDEFRTLAVKEGVQLTDLLKRLKDNGACSVVIKEDTLSSLSRDGRIILMNDQDIAKMAVQGEFAKKFPLPQNTAGSLWVYSEDAELIDRIVYILGLKIGSDKLIRIHRNLLSINKSSEGLTDRVGLGFSKEIIESVRDYDLGQILRMSNYPGMTEKTVQRILNALPTPARVAGLFFEGQEALGYRGELDKIAELFRRRAYRIGEIEFTNQKGFNTYKKLLKDKRLIVKVHGISRKEMDLKYNPETAVYRWVRAARERSVRILHLRCFYQPEDGLINDLVDYNLKYLKKTKEALEEAGLSLALSPEQRLNEGRLVVGHPEWAELLAIGLALFMGWIILLKLTVLPDMKNGPALLFIVLIFLCFPLVSRQNWIIAAGISGAVTYASIGVIWGMNDLNKNRSNNFFILLLSFGFKMVIVAIFGGILIVGLHSDVDYLLKYSQFRGVKAAFILPVLISFVWAVKLYGIKFFKWLHKPLNFFAFALIVAVGMAGALYIIRSGNALFLKPLACEEAFRNLLEKLFEARPRNKEFLIGYPALFLFLFFWLRRSFTALPILAVFMQMAPVSVINSFCHFHTPLSFTSLRIFNGLCMGLVMGAIAVIAVAVIRFFYLVTLEKPKKALLLGYFGFGNMGDELLWQTFAAKFLSDNPQWEVSVLYKGSTTQSSDDGCITVGRSCFLDVIDSIITAKIFVVPGGGVFQSATSVKSLAYYTLITYFSWLCGAKILLLSQGLGPWRVETFWGRCFQKLTAFILKNADYVSVRDDGAGFEYLKLTGKSERVLAPDLAFLDKSVNKASMRSVHKVMKIFAVLRSSVPQSADIAKALLSLAQSDKTFEVYPAYMQPGEDEQVWRDIGWTGPIVEAVSKDGALFQGADAVLSMRLHGCILSTIACIPWLGVAYDPKVSGFCDVNGWEFYVNPEEATEENLKQVFKQFKKSRTVFSEALHKIASANTENADADYRKALKTADIL